MFNIHEIRYHEHQLTRPDKDDSYAARYARMIAVNYLQRWITYLRSYIDRKPGTKPALYCQSEIDRLTQIINTPTPEQAYNLERAWNWQKSNR